MTRQRSEIFSMVARKSALGRAVLHRRRLGAPGSEKVGQFLLILAGLLMTSPPTIYGQADTDTPDPVSGRAVSVEKIIPADVLARVELLRKGLDLIRSEMGRAKDQRPEIAVSNVTRARSSFRPPRCFERRTSFASK